LRAFFGIPVSESAREDITVQIRDIVLKYPDLKWVRPENYHITLLFLGDIEDSQMKSVLSDSAGNLPRAFSAGLSGVHQFPPRGRARVVVTGVERGAPQCEALYNYLAKNRALRPYVSARRYVPHVTLARIKGGRRSPDLSCIEVPLISDFKIDRYILYQSILRPSGAEYVKLKEYMLTE
jgi:RNA 2',3'-cyclic 3'-phosphodiesterase